MKRVDQRLVKPCAICGEIRPIMLPMCVGTKQEHALCSTCWRKEP